MKAPKLETFSGRTFSRKTITEIVEIVGSCPGPSVTLVNIFKPKSRDKIISKRGINNKVAAG